VCTNTRPTISHYVIISVDTCQGVVRYCPMQRIKDCADHMEGSEGVSCKTGNFDLGTPRIGHTEGWRVILNRDRRNTTET
jgi:hypothetical protein